MVLFVLGHLVDLEVQLHHFYQCLRFLREIQLVLMDQEVLVVPIIAKKLIVRVHFCCLQPTGGPGSPCPPPIVVPPFVVSPFCIVEFILHK